MKCLLQVIEELTKRMAEGMAEFIEREVVTVADYDRYCYFVAGIVGIGLSRVRTSQTLPQTYNPPSSCALWCCNLSLQPFSCTVLWQLHLYE